MGMAKSDRKTLANRRNASLPRKRKKDQAQAVKV
jgi:hypothetical protein